MGKLDHIPEFTDALTFFAWKTQILLALDCEGAYSHVSDGTDPLDPVEFASEQPQAANPTKITDAEKKAILGWSKDNAVAKDILCCHLSPAVLCLIPQERSTTARDIWKALHDNFCWNIKSFYNFDHINVSSHHLVHVKILHLDAAQYLSEHSAAQQDLIRMGASYSDEEAISHLIEGLPDTGTWLSFRLFLQTSCLTKTPAPTASTTSASQAGSSVSAVLSTGSCDET
ncbi:hypothetical protein BKA82DRAFT_140655 [Pisolithus tinctorius]|uniref:Uncharacterized protein n=1 Tax=Pisolithus tinctorius Marx 270 TaxID=870435 RepID=A0A0C3J950_PISTI|nr:hypothetical protein BKA82DRAFT_140655 [Pisolithus tinctorius]KIO05573.1 hypothetical protein M404DRAFT_140655 [Pisolithus tinctorius Marx 270]